MVRLRRLLARSIPGAIAVGVLTAHPTVVYGQSASGQGSIRIVDGASTAVITDALQRLSLMVSWENAGNTGLRVGDANAGGALSMSGTGATGLVASIVQTSDGILNTANAPARSINSTKQRESGKNLVLAQYN